MPLPENIIILFYWTAPGAAVFLLRKRNAKTAMLPAKRAAA